MAYEDFVKLYAADVKSTPHVLLNKKPLSFPLSTVSRGQSLIDSLGQVIDFDLRGKRVLDVGCAYGGFSIAMAKAGAEAIGIDVNPRFIDYARANAAGVAEIDFKVVDASSAEVRKALPKGVFDFVLLNDVLEHIYDTASLVANLDWLLNDTGVVFFKVPNGLSPRFVLSEGHRHIFGLTVLDPDCWFYLYPKRASIFYRPLTHFQAIFSYFGLSQNLLLDGERVFARMTVRKLQNQIREIFIKAKDFEYPDRSLRVLLRQGILKFRNEFVYDVETEPAEYVQYKYGSYFFTGFFGRPGASLRALTPAHDLAKVGTILQRPAGPVAEEADQGALGVDANRVLT